MLSKRYVFNCVVVLALLAGLGACRPPATVTVPPDTATPGQATLTPTPETEEKPIPVLPSERDHHPYNWKPEDVKGLDPWGDSISNGRDLIAIYERQNEKVFEFRLDILDFQEGKLAPIYFAIDFQDGGSTQVASENNALSFEIEWDLLVSVVGGDFRLYDPSFTELTEQLKNTEINTQLDFIFFSISDSAFAGWDGNAFQVQALLLNAANSAVLDQTTPAATDNTTGRAKLVLPVMDITFAWDPSTAVDSYAGFYRAPFDGRPDPRPGEHRGGRYILDTVERYEIPLTLNDLMINDLPGNEYLRVHERLRHLASKGLFDPLTTLEYGHFMAWQPDDVDVKAIQIVKELREGLDLPVSKVFYPYEAMLTPGDIQVLKEAGFEAIFAYDQARYSFLGWIDDYWSNPNAHKDDIESVRKIHQFNGMKFVFHTWTGNYAAFSGDERWWRDWVESYDEYELYAGTDQGLHLWFRRILHDMAMDPDQEQFYTIGTDLLLTPWLFQDVIERNFQWLAGHPWIEVTTFSSILNRGWEVMDHGDIDLAPEELLMRHQYEGDGYYNAYFPQHYYGGISDGHSPVIPAGAEIESYYDYVPYLRDGQLIPSGRIMGDDQTPGSIIYETLANLRKAPDNPITTLAWLSYFMDIGEQTFHEGANLRGGAKMQANFIGQVNKIAEAAHWAAEAEQGTLANGTRVYEKDLDLDGELEYVMSNDRVFAIFENDGGRLEYAFVHDPEYGPIQVILPASQYVYKPSPDDGFDLQNGEAAISLGWAWSPDGAFVEDIDSDGRFEYEPLSASIEGQSLTFTYETRPAAKTFTLEGDTIHVHYDLGSAKTLNLGFSSAVNRLGVFDKDWIKNFQPLPMREVLGWQMTSGGSVFLNMEKPYSVSTASFSDSPAREEMQTRENANTYPVGHWMCFPCSWIKIRGVKDVDFSLTLSAAPIDRGVYTPLPTPLPTLTLPTSTPLPTPTASPTPSQKQSEGDYLIYDDGLSAYWSLDPWGGSADSNASEVVYEGAQAIEVSLQPGVGITFDVGSPPDITEYAWLVFYLNGGATADQQLYVLMKTKDNIPLGDRAYLVDYIEDYPLQPRQWHRVAVPLSLLDPEGKTFAWFDIGDASGNGASTFYIDEIRFVTSGP